MIRYADLKSRTGTLSSLTAASQFTIWIKTRDFSKLSKLKVKSFDAVLLQVSQCDLGKPSRDKAGKKRRLPLQKWRRVHHPNNGWWVTYSDKTRHKASERRKIKRSAYGVKITCWLLGERYKLQRLKPLAQPCHMFPSHWARGNTETQLCCEPNSLFQLFSTRNVLLCKMIAACRCLISSLSKAGKKTKQLSSTSMFIK